MKIVKNWLRLISAVLAGVLLLCAVSCTENAAEAEPSEDFAAVISEDASGYRFSMKTSDSATAEGIDGWYGTGEYTDVTDGGTDEVPVDLEPDIEYKAGLLTAAEWKDLDNWDFWKKLINENNWYELIDNWGLWAKNRIVVHFGADTPLDNVTVTLQKQDGTVVYTAVSDREGNAYLFYTDKEASYVISYVLGGETFSMDWNAADSDTVNVAATGTKNKLKLDLMFVVDTTGSMGDELSFLKAELADVITKVQTSLQIPVRTSVNFYRDTEDEYVVLPFDFTTDLTAVQKELDAQYSEGGGDYPEAVHTALENAVNEHDWAENSVKLLFLVLDAPAHDDAAVKAQLQQTINDAAAKGIRIIPVASSGVDTSSEALFRSFAVLTGGTYVFLTNDSGIGGDHLEATVGEHEVEYLNDLLVRVIGEYCQ